MAINTFYKQGNKSIWKDHNTQYKWRKRIHNNLIFINKGISLLTDELARMFKIDKNLRREIGSRDTKPSHLFRTKALTVSSGHIPSYLNGICYLNGVFQKKKSHLPTSSEENNLEDVSKIHMILLLLLLYHCCFVCVYFPSCNWLVSSSLGQFGFPNLVS